MFKLWKYHVAAQICGSRGSFQVNVSERHWNFAAVALHLIQTLNKQHLRWNFTNYPLSQIYTRYKQLAWRVAISLGSSCASTHTHEIQRSPPPRARTASHRQWVWEMESRARVCGDHNNSIVTLETRRFLHPIIWVMDAASLHSLMPRQITP